MVLPVKSAFERSLALKGRQPFACRCWLRRLNVCGSVDYIAKRLFAPNLIKPPVVEIARVGLVYVSNLTEQALYFLAMFYKIIWENLSAWFPVIMGHK